MIKYALLYGNVQVKEEAGAPFVQSGCVRKAPSTKIEKRCSKCWKTSLYPSEEPVHREIKATGHAVQMYEIEIGA